MGSIGAAHAESFSWGDNALAAVLPMDEALAPVVGGRDNVIRMTLPVGTLRSGDRFLEALVEHDENVSADDLQWRVEVIPVGDNDPVAVSTRAASASRAVFRFDARAAGNGMVRVRLFHDDNQLDVVEHQYTVEAGQSLVDRPAPEILLTRPDNAPGSVDAEHWVTFGLPLPRGALWDATGLGLEDGSGKSIPAQFHPVAHWGEEGSLKWLRVDAMARGVGSPRVAVAGDDADFDRDLRINRGDDFVEIETGPASYRIEPRGAIVNRIANDEGRISEYTGSGRGLYVVDQKGRVGTPGDDTEMEWEFAGPLTARIKVAGVYRTEDGEELARFNLWLDFAAGRSECRVTHHIVLTRNTNEVWFTDIGWEFDFGDWTADTAVLAAPRGEPGAGLTKPLAEGVFVAAQTEHRRYGGGTDRYRIHAGGDDADLHDGEMGDWAAAIGDGRGMLIACRETARQHPKAFRVSSGFIALDLFHPDAGEELDFRAPALVERWNTGGRLGDRLARETSDLETNAVGWSKTHFLEISPVVSAEQAEAAGDAFTFPLKGVADPRWTWQTEVVGPLYPRDRERFPEAEDFIGDAFAYWEEEQEYFGEYGFVDFFAGPHHTRGFPQSQGRFRASYTLRNAFWLLYMRSGESKFRDMATWSNRVYLDSYIANWDGPQRIRGLYLHSVGPTDPYASLPFYWEGFTRPSLGTHTNLDQFLLDYYLTGNPRAKAGVLEYAEGVKRWWQQNQSDWRILAVLRAINRAYSLTWDPELRLIQEQILNTVYDPNSPVFLIAKGRPYNSSTYKTQEDLAGLIEGWELHGTARYRNIATATSRYWWEALAPGTRFERGRSGAFLWRWDQDPTLAQRLWTAVREESVLPAESTSAMAVFRFQGMPYALDVVAQTDADLAPVAAWAGAEVLTGNAGVVLRKAEGEAMRATMLFDREGLTQLPDIHPLGDTSQTGLRLLGLSTGYGEAIRLNVPADTEPVDLFIPLPEFGGHRAFLDRMAPFSLYADGWWKPIPEKLDPAARIYFELPPGIDRPSIQFEHSSRLFAPDGTPWPDDQTVRGRIDLPAGKPGTWSFSPVESGAVRVRNLPPFFSFDSPDALFAVATDTLPLPPRHTFGVVNGLRLGPNEILSIEADGEDALPFQEGTIEFHYRPGWDSFDLTGRTIKRLMNVETTNDRNWSLRYVVDPGRAGWPGHPWSRSHVLEMEIETEGPARTRALCIRRAIIEEGEWMHVAIVWGQRMFGHSAATTRPAFDVKLFINGVEGKFATWPRQGNTVAAEPVRINFGPHLDGEIANLRISNVRRYTEDFPAPRGAQIEVDEDTVWWFPLEESLDGYNASGNQAVRAVLNKP